MKISSLSLGLSTLALPLALMAQDYQYNASSSIREIMWAMADPPAAALWNASNGQFNPDGTMAIPDDPSHWDQLKRQAIILGEVGNLMNTPGRRAEPDTPGATSPDELSAAEIEALIAANRPAWQAFSRALDQVAQAYIEAIDNRDSAAFEWDNLGDQMNQVCTGCHVVFWYPNAPEGLF
jgi:hypothetical protein